MILQEFYAPEEERLSGSGNEGPTIQEKIILEGQHTGFSRETVGPAIDLFFHELAGDHYILKSIFSKIIAVLLFAVLIVLLPLVAIAIKISSSGPVLIRQTCTGIGGQLFHRYLFRIAGKDPNMYSFSDVKEHTFWVGKILKITGLYELPSVINILKNDMNLIGPKVHPLALSNYWNNQLTEYYKRFAVKPGLIGIKDAHTGHTEETEKIKRILKKEFRYLLNPTFSKDMKILFGSF